ncbi:helix-turn-helix domain-containing protein [uncultured Bacteroides sp.]|uniref:AraC family transcriptional regulator n=1 Tax=uncultured Bacteroides sp. TaxID=162156 RepID=UPI00280B6631|nr:helix-turn-helix domain-containing protein [uncultured Bacteroides sp.]
MEKKTPLNIGLEILGNLDIVRHNEFRFISPHFGFVNSFARLESLLITLDQPYRIKEGRIAIIKQGYARVLINLIEETFQPDKMLLIVPNSILQLIEVSPDFDMQMVAMDSEFLPITGKDDFFTHLSQLQKNIILSLTPQESYQFKSYFDLMWNILQESPFHREVIQHLLVSLLYNIEYLAHNNGNAQNHQTRQEEIFQRFISLVNTYSKKERNVVFYADKLCLTPRYLNTVVRQTSQQTVMDWINQSIILEAKVLLKHSNLLVYQISDELNFPNPSFFCKFFKRMTGITPREYQNPK